MPGKKGMRYTETQRKGGPGQGQGPRRLGEYVGEQRRAGGEFIYLVKCEISGPAHLPAVVQMKGSQTARDDLHVCAAGSRGQEGRRPLALGGTRCGCAIVRSGRPPVLERGRVLELERCCDAG